MKNFSSEDALFEAAMFVAAATTGLTPEFLNMESEAPKDFLSELEKLGYDVAVFYKEGAEIAHQWQQYQDEQAVFDNLQKSRAREVIDVMNTLPLEHAFDQHPIDEFNANLGKVMSENLDEQSVWEFVRQVVEMHTSIQAKEKAFKRHKENHAMKRDVFAWLDNNFAGYRSMDSAAESIAKCVAPIAFRTAREWVGEWKKLRSTGRP